MQQISQKEMKESPENLRTRLAAEMKTLEQNHCDTLLRILSEARLKENLQVSLSVSLRLLRRCFGISILLWRRAIR